ncbi:hypothetical protein J2S48_003902 [Promicromonospora iranensis]|uniref:Secreted protein with PEP-CTERM sorting signal n=1 Tax=Promicromonospora iranensis TaxID=1105144 RepID=A0ABU2CSS8_9MICO|nr:hypothetical protein [Promicromonospora iranensis]
MVGILLLIGGVATMLRIRSSDRAAQSSGILRWIPVALFASAAAAVAVAAFL